MKNPTDKTILSKEELNLEQYHHLANSLHVVNHNLSHVDLDELELEQPLPAVVPNTPELTAVKKKQREANEYVMGFEYLENLTLEECAYRNFSRWLPDTTKYNELARKDKK